jgi:hypothetical protein
MPAIMVHVYNPSYSEDKDWEDLLSKPELAKSQTDLISMNKWGTVFHVCDPSDAGGIGRITAQDWCETFLKK